MQALSPLSLLTFAYRQDACPAGEKEVEMLHFLDSQAFTLVADQDHYPDWTFTYKGFLMGSDPEASVLELAYDGHWFRTTTQGKGGRERVEEKGRSTVESWIALCSTAEPTAMVL